MLKSIDVNKPTAPTPKKKKEKASSLCLTPPALLNLRGRDFHRGLCLGEGGFARCFQVKDSSGQIFAAKTIAKKSMESPKTRQKLLAEIKIHRSLSHPNVCRFIDCFEDNTNVYILLEICPNGSLMEMTKRRKRLSEPEVRFYAVQIAGAVKYMHARGVIHRDLKLGNIFLDEHMNAKVGDFGLATVSDGTRRTTICGTPNYIAPEVLLGKKSGGHSFEVDIWSLGIIAYAMLVGKPPFQSKEIEVIYQRIRDNDFAYPEGTSVSLQAKNLINDILNSDPLKRPSIDDMVAYDFFSGGYFPSRISTQSLTHAPTFRQVSSERNRRNFIDAKIASGLAQQAENYKTVSPTVNKYDPVKITKADVESESRQVLPTSVSPASTKDKYKLVVVKSVPQPSGLRKTVASGQAGDERAGDGQPGQSSQSGRGLDDNSTQAVTRAARDSRAQPPAPSRPVSAAEATIQLPAKRPFGTVEGRRFISSLVWSRLAHAIGYNMGEYDKGEIKLHEDAHRNLTSDDSNAVVFVSRWVDHTNKYGMAYQLNNGDVGMNYMDGTSMILDGVTEEATLFWSASGEIHRRAVDIKYAGPAERKRLKIITHLRRYMEEYLTRSDQGAQAVDQSLRPHVYMTQFKHLAQDDEFPQFQGDTRMFELSNGSVQFNFADHTKVIVTIRKRDQLVGFIDEDKKLHVWTLQRALMVSTGNELVSKLRFIGKVLEARKLV